MNLQDIRYIAAIAEKGSINKASRTLFVSQPSLSKCIRKVENEYGITLFTRTKGSSLELTPEGRCFLEMANEVLHSHELFESRLRQLKFRNQNNILFGTTIQRSYVLAAPLLKWLFEHYRQYFIELHTNKTVQLEADLLEGNLDMVLIGSHEQKDALHYETLSSSWQWIYLREDSPAAQKATYIDSLEFPVLRLEDLKDEKIIANTPGSGSRANLDKILETARIELDIIDLPNWDNRIAMVEGGKASSFIRLDIIKGAESLLKNQLFFLHPDQNIASLTSFVCRQGFETDPRFQAVLKGLKTIYKTHS